MSAPCEELTASQVAARALAVLDEKETAQLDAHLASCEGCRGVARTVEASFDEASVEKVAAPDDAWRAIEKGLDRLEGKGPQVSLACTYCKDGLDRETAVFCAGCLAPHHEDCFKEHGRCAACREARFVHPSAPARRRWPRVVGPIVALGLGLGVAAARLGNERDAAPATVATKPASAPAAPKSPPPDTVSIHAPAGTRLGALLDDLNGPSVHRWFTNDPERRVQFDCDDCSRDEAVKRFARETGAALVTLTGDATLVDFEPGVDLHGHDTSVVEVLKTIAAAGKQQLLYATNANPEITLDHHFASWVTALSAVTKTAGLSVRRRGDVLLVRRADEESMWGTQDIAAAEGDCWKVEYDDHSVPLRARRSPPSRHLTVDAREVSVPKWAYFAGAFAGKGVITPPSISSSVNLHLADVSGFDALLAGLATVGCGVVPVETDSVSIIAGTGGTDVDWSDGDSRTVDDLSHGPRRPYLEATFVDRDDPARSRAILADGLRKVGDRTDPDSEYCVVAIEPGRVLLEHVATEARYYAVLRAIELEPARPTRPADERSDAVLVTHVEAAIAAVESANGHDPDLALTGAARALVERYRWRVGHEGAEDTVDAWHRRINAHLDVFDGRDHVPVAQCRFDLDEMVRANAEGRFSDAVEAFEDICRVYESSEGMTTRPEMRRFLEQAKPLAKVALAKLEAAK